MQNQSLRNLLEQVDAEIKNTETLDQQGIELLSRLSADINELLEKSNTARETEANFADRLAQAIDHFESSHPTLTSQLAQLSMILSNAGI